MRLVLLATSALVILGAPAAMSADIGGAPDYYYAPPVAASPAPSGVFGDATLSAAFLANDLSDDDWAAEIGGVFVFPFGNGWNVSLGGGAAYFFDSDEWAASIETDLFYATSTWAAGGFIGAADEEAYFVGLEGAAFVGNFDFVTEVWYTSADTDSVTATLDANYYFNPDTVLVASLGSRWFDGGGDYQTASLGAEHRFASTPVTGFLAAGWDNSGGDNFQVTAGTRILFGNSGTLQDYFRANPF